MIRKLTLTFMSLLLTLSMVLPQGLQTVRAQQSEDVPDISVHSVEMNRESSSPEDENAYAYINVDIDKTRFIHHNARPQAEDALPTSYSLVSEGYVTSVKNQNPYGTCWTFSTMASAESGILKKYGQTKDLAELQMAYFNYNSYQKADPLNLITNDGTKGSSPDGVLNIGGNAYFSTFALASGIGFCDETDYPYGTSVTSKPCYKASYLLREARWLYLQETDAVKRALMEHGALAVSYYHSDSYVNYTSSGDCAYYQNSYDGDYSNHAVTLVGWDDNYSRTNFKSSKRPTKNGAWLIKNSWGTSWGNKGYFWISYEDTSIQGSEAVFYGVDLEDNYTLETANLYQYDGSGMAGWENYGKTVYASNIYQTINDGEVLREVGFFVDQTGLDYTISIYNNVSSTPTSGTLATTQSGRLEDAGYYLLKLDNPVRLTKGAKYSVVIKLTSSSEDVNLFLDWDYSYNWSDGSSVKFYNNVTNDLSFYSTNGTSWTSLTSEGYTARIKAITTEVETCQVSFVNYDGTVLQSGTVPVGDTPVYEGETPSRPDDEQYTYTFKGWTPEIGPVETDTVYTATYDKHEYTDIAITSLKNEGTDGGINVSFLKVSGAERYQVDVSEDGESWLTLTDSVADNSYSDIAAVIMGKTYTYRVRAYANGQWGDFSETASLLRNPFRDVQEGTDHFTHVAWAYNNGIVNGLSSDHTRFGLTGKCTRTQFCIMLWKMAGRPDTTGMECPFEDIDDVTENNKRGIIWCYNQGIVNGTSATTFNPSGDITRAQLAIMVYKLAGMPSVSGQSCPYVDLAGLTANNKKAIIWCYNNGLINSLTDTYFFPKVKGTRALLAEMLYGAEQVLHIFENAQN